MARSSTSTRSPLVTAVESGVVDVYPCAVWLCRRDGSLPCLHFDSCAHTARSCWLLTACWTSPCPARTHRRALPPSLRLRSPPRPPPSHDPTYSTTRHTRPAKRRTGSRTLDCAGSRTSPSSNHLYHPFTPLPASCELGARLARLPLSPLSRSAPSLRSPSRSPFPAFFVSLACRMALRAGIHALIQSETRQTSASSRTRASPSRPHLGRLDVVLRALPTPLLLLTPSCSSRSPPSVSPTSACPVCPHRAESEENRRHLGLEELARSNSVGQWSNAQHLPVQLLRARQVCAGEKTWRPGRGGRTARPPAQRDSRGGGSEGTTSAAAKLSRGEAPYPQNFAVQAHFPFFFGSTAFEGLVIFRDTLLVRTLSKYWHLRTAPRLQYNYSSTSKPCLSHLDRALGPGPLVHPSCFAAAACISACSVEWV
ncbi:hypothetical protein OF846_000740 [Rhodotorula toruloides]|nr:hypothetical protein OF846_000740 [Rhodotorula toruloides]